MSATKNSVACLVSCDYMMFDYLIPAIQSSCDEYSVQCKCYYEGNEMVEEIRGAGCGKDGNAGLKIVATRKSCKRLLQAIDIRVEFTGKARDLLSIFLLYCCGRYVNEMIVVPVDIPLDKHVEYVLERAPKWFKQSKLTIRGQNVAWVPIAASSFNQPEGMAGQVYRLWYDESVWNASVPSNTRDESREVQHG